MAPEMVVRSDRASSNLPPPTTLASSFIFDSSEDDAISQIKDETAMRGLPVDENNTVLRDTVLRTFLLFQLCVSAPVAASLGVSAYVRLVEVHGPVYDFVASLLTSMMAAAIVFILILQRRTFEQGLPIDLTLKFEEAKSALATSLWIWEMVDAGVQPTTMWNRRGPRMAAAGISALVLL